MEMMMKQGSINHFWIAPAHEVSSQRKTIWLRWTHNCMDQRRDDGSSWFFRNVNTSNTARCINPQDRHLILPNKLTVTQPAKKFLAFYSTRRLTAVFTRAHHWSVSWARWIQSTTSHSISLRSIVILFSHFHLGLQMISSIQVFQSKYCKHFSPLSFMLHAPPISFTLIWSPE